MCGAQQSLFPVGDGRPPGFRYAADFVPLPEAAALLRAFAALPLAPFQFHGYVGHRRVASFGWSYDYSASRLAPAPPLPAFLLPLRARAAAFADVADADLVQALVTEYRPGVTIGWHRDKAAFGVVVGVSFGAVATLRFRRRAHDGWTRRSVSLAPRSAYVLAGEARDHWEHSIAPVTALRYSVTFRTLAR